MECLRAIGIVGVVILTGFVFAGQIPAGGDDWSEYSTAAEAEADGWTRTCGLSQQITISADDPNTGSYSVGCRAVQANWYKPFHLAKSVSLAGVTEFRFAHKDSWESRNVALRIYMTPSVSEQAAGITEKRLVFNYQTATGWVLMNTSFDSGTWDWNDDSNMWSAAGDTELTELTKIEWYANYLPPWSLVSIGDSMLFDGLYFVGPDSDLEELAEFCSWWMTGICDGINDYCDGYDFELDGDVDMADFNLFAETWPD